MGGGLRKPAAAQKSASAAQDAQAAEAAAEKAATEKAAAEKAAAKAAEEKASEEPQMDPEEQRVNLEWHWWTQGMFLTLSFLELSDVSAVAQVNKLWRRVANRYMRDFEPNLESDEVSWIKSQIDQNSLFFEKAAITTLCKLTVQGREDSQPTGESPQIQELQLRIRQHKGHYATFPALAMRLLSSLGKVDDSSKQHELVFRCKHNQRRCLVSNTGFLDKLRKFIAEMHATVAVDLLTAGESLRAASRECAESCVKRLVQEESILVGQALTVDTLIDSDLVDPLASYQSSLEARMARLRKEVRKTLLDATVQQREWVASGPRSSEGKPGITLERCIPDSCDAVVRSFILKHFDFLIKALSQAFFDPILEDVMSRKFFSKRARQLLDDHIAATNGHRRIEGTFEGLIGIVPELPPETTACLELSLNTPPSQTTSTRSSKSSAGLTVASALASPASAVIPVAPIEAKLADEAKAGEPAAGESKEEGKDAEEQKEEKAESKDSTGDVVEGEAPAPDGLSAPLSGGSKRPRPQWLQRAEECLELWRTTMPGLPSYEALRTVEAHVDEYLDHFLDQRAESREAVPGSGSRLDELRCSLPRSREEIANKPPGWLSEHVVAVYMAAAVSEADAGADAVRAVEDGREAWSPLVRDFAARRYIYHALTKENASRVINYAPRGDIAALPHERREHVQLLSAAVRDSLLRDCGSLDNTMPTSQRFFHRVKEDNAFMYALVGLSLKSLVCLISEKRRDMAEFEKFRRKSDLD